MEDRIKWEAMLSGIQKKGRRIQRVRKIIVTGASVIVLTLTFAFYRNYNKIELKEFAANSHNTQIIQQNGLKSMEISMMMDDAVFYDDEMGLIGSR